MIDPNPGQVLLDVLEVAALLGMSKRVFLRFLGETPGFPRPIAVGTVKARGRGAKDKPPVPRQRWRKWEVLAWLMTQPPVSHVHDVGTD